MPTVNTRCTQCGNENENEVSDDDLKFGTGRSHGTEVVTCYTCSSECVECEEQDEPCQRCKEETVQNRCGSSVPMAKE